MRRLLMVAVIALGAAAAARADELIWDNNGTTINPNLSVITIFDTVGTPGSVTSEAADDFILTAPATVTQIWPQYFFGALFTIDYWNIVIYDDNAGVPGTVLHSTTAPGASYVASPPDQVLSLTLAQPFAAAANTRYWISLQAAFDQVQGRGVRWREIVVIDPSEIHGNVGYWRGTPPFGGLVGDWIWEAVGNKNSVGTTAELIFQLYGLRATGACCFSDGACRTLSATACAADGGTYLGDDTDCTPGLCTGACCYGTHQCTVETHAFCTVLLGTFLGYGTTCDGNPCGYPVGACCDPGGGCRISDQPACEASFCLYIGDGTTCDPNPCPPGMPNTPGACCFGTPGQATCEIRPYLNCVQSGGVYRGPFSDCFPNPCGYEYDYWLDTATGEKGGNGWPDDGHSNRYTYGWWIVYPETGGWVNQWWRNEVLAPPAVKQITISFVLQFAGAAPTVAINYSTPDWTNSDNPPGPADEEFIQRVPVDPPITQPGSYTFPLQLPFCPLWVSVDAMSNGGDFSIEGWIDHVCLPTGACCVDATCTPDVTEPYCTATLGGVWKGQGSVCDPNPCIGACCGLGGGGYGRVCYGEMPPATCETIYCAVYMGDATTCNQVICDAPTGACCFGVPGQATCELRTYADCTGAGGAWRGPCSDCFPNPCGYDIDYYLDTATGEQGGNGWSDGQWILYPETGWTNQWWKNDVLPPPAVKQITISFDVQFPGPAPTVAVNYSTPDWTDSASPPGPADEQFIQRVPVDPAITQPGSYTFMVQVPFCPLWVSVDVMGNGGDFSIEGSITHVCLPTTGACCVGITCTDNVSAADCQTMGGVYKGDGSVCDPVATACYGDADCSRAIDFDDINYFVAALAGGEAGWTSYYLSKNGTPPPCTYWNCDANGSGRCNDPPAPEVDFDDINPFVAKLVTPPNCP